MDDIRKAFASAKTRSLIDAINEPLQNMRESVPAHESSVYDYHQIDEWRQAAMRRIAVAQLRMSSSGCQLASALHLLREARRCLGQPNMIDGVTEAIDRFLADTPRLKATVEPQAWLNDYAIPVDAPGETSWDCTEYALDQLGDGMLKEIEQTGGFVDLDDVLKSDPVAPTWLREWQGPFTITVDVAL